MKLIALLLVMLSAQLQAQYLDYYRTHNRFINVTPPPSGATGQFYFTLTVGSGTSAGVFDKAGKLIKTLWNDKFYQPGRYPLTWDGTDDKGVKLLSPASEYDVKVLTDNVKYKWLGTIGNSSDSATGPTKHRGYYHCMRGLVFIGGVGYFCAGYSEGSPSLGWFNINTPNQKHEFFTSRTQTGDINYVCADATTVYWGAFDANEKDQSWVFGTKTSDKTEFLFPAGSPDTVKYGKVYTRAISISKQPNCLITGMAVQQSGNYLFVARAGRNQVDVINKTTGATVRTIGLVTPGSMCVDKQDNLWVITAGTVQKFAVNGDGSLTAALLTINSLSHPEAVAVSAGGTLVSIANGGTYQQVKWFSNTSGVAVDELGTAGGYYTDPTVNNNKFYFNDSLSKKLTFIAYQPDGSFWVNDPGNYRVQHYDSAKNFINRIMSLGATYSTWVDKKNIHRVWAGYLEFNVDYTTMQWSLVKNWGANISSRYDQSSKFAYITTLSNGRTFAFLRVGNNRELVEFPASGQLIKSGLMRAGLGYILMADGSLNQYTRGNFGGVGRMHNYALTGFNVNGFPTWSSTPTLVFTTPVLTVDDPNTGPRFEMLTSTGKYLTYAYNSVHTFVNGVPTLFHTGYHLGAINTGGSEWEWLTERATHKNYMGAYPGPGWFDIGNNVNDFAGGGLCVVGQNIITTYHGEFWKNSQTNKFNHYWDNGLAIGQFGITRPEVGFGVHAGYFMAGNNLNPIMVMDSSTGKMYIVHGDESDHAGLHVEEISDLNTIDSVTIPMPYPSAPTQAALKYVDLMANLPFDDTLSTNFGWTRSAIENKVAANKFTDYYTVNTSVLKYEKLETPDIHVWFVSNKARTNTVSRTLGQNTGATNWKIEGDLAYSDNMPNGQNTNSFLEVLDGAGKTLTRFYPVINRSVIPARCAIMANRDTLATGTESGIRNAMSGYLPFTISAVAGVITFSYGDYTQTSDVIMDATGTWNDPATLQYRNVSTATSGGVYKAVIDFKNLKFYRNFLAPEL